MAIRPMQTGFTNRWRARHTPPERVLRTIRHWLPRAVALFIAPVVLGSCTGWGDLRTDLSPLQSDLSTNTAALSQLSARVDELERRQAATDRSVRHMQQDVRQTQQELTQAIDVLLKKALMMENRQAISRSARALLKSAEKPDRQARQQLTEARDAAPQGGKQISLGMTQADVRRTLGDPISIDNSGSYIFWQYSEMSNQKYVVFEKVTGQVWGWRGL
jgi:hypothetical protein